MLASWASRAFGGSIPYRGLCVPVVPAASWWGLGTSWSKRSSLRRHSGYVCQLTPSRSFISSVRVLLALGDRTELPSHNRNPIWGDLWVHRQRVSGVYAASQLLEVHIPTATSSSCITRTQETIKILKTQPKCPSDLPRPLHEFRDPPPIPLGELLRLPDLVFVHKCLLYDDLSLRRSGPPARPPTSSHHPPLTHRPSRTR